MGDPRGRGRPARLPVGRVVRPRGADGRRDRVRGGGGDRRARRLPSDVRRAGAGGVAARHRGVAGRGGRRRCEPTSASARSTPSGRWSTWSPRAPWPSSGPSSPIPGPRPATTSGGWSTRRFASLVADRLAPGARWRLATDWADYAEQMATVLDAEPALSGGVVERWDERPVTKFERKGIEAGTLHHRPLLRAAMSQPRSTPARSSSASVRRRSLSRSRPSVSRSSSVGTSSARQASSNASS